MGPMVWVQKHGGMVGWWLLWGQEGERRTLFRSTTPIAILRRRSRLSTLVSDAPATPPPPNFEPTRFWERNV